MGTAVVDASTVGIVFARRRSAFARHNRNGELRRDK